MSKDILQRTKSIWQQKGDEELIVASEHLSEYTKEAEEIIRAELKRRRMPEPEPTVRDETVRDEKAKLNYTDKIKLMSIPSSVFFFVGGVIQIIGLSDSYNQKERDKSILIAVVCLSVGGVLLAVGLYHLILTRLTPPPAPTTQLDVTQSVSPKSVELGNTPDEVQSVMGQPDKIMNLGARVIHVYKDMKIIYVDGKVSDVQLS